MQNHRSELLRSSGEGKSGESGDPSGLLGFSLLRAQMLRFVTLFLGLYMISSPAARAEGEVVMNKIQKSNTEWKKELTPEQYKVLREKGTEAAFTGQYCNLKDKGVYRCAACGTELFSSQTKFESGTGWPSFYEPI